jgi:hypothetical protein
MDDFSSKIAASSNAAVAVQYTTLITYCALLKAVTAAMAPAAAVDELNGVAKGTHGPAFTAVYDMYLDHAFKARRARNNLRELL